MASGPAGGKCVLVIDDDATTRQALTMILEGAGYAVIVAADGREALARVRAGPRPDLIFLDLMMPGMDGWSFRAEQQKDPALAAIPVVVISAAGNLQQKAASLGAASLLQKPIEFDQLLEAVQRFATAQRPGVLVVEDEAPIRSLLGLALRQHSLAVWAAAGGDEAVELYRQHQADIAVVLLDVQMPGLDGPGTLVTLKRINPDVRCCFMTGYTGNYTAEGLLEMGACAVFPKPFRLAEVAQGLRRLAGGKASTGGKADD